ncbi:MAG: DUF2080 family transposase-associated protein [Deltaproteobacteria bacterium]|nr:DUF2080 family transposase-associated protein [Deltaproteobacteria bacterium]
MPDDSRTVSKSKRPSAGKTRGKVKLEAYGMEMVEKEVRSCGVSGRIYLPKDWVGRHVKIIRLD